MSDYTAKRIDEMETSFAGTFIRARAELGVTSFGMQVVVLPPNLAEGYPEHDHTHDGQEEVFIPLSGRGEIFIDGERVELSPEMMVRVGPESKRRVVTGGEPLRLLIVSGVPGGVYEPSPNSILGTPDPFAQPQS